MESRRSGEEKKVLHDAVDELIQTLNMGFSMVVLYDREGTVLGWNQQAEKLFQQAKEDEINMMQLMPHVFYKYAGEVHMESEYSSSKNRAIVYPVGAGCIPVELKVYNKVIENTSIGICVMRDLTDQMESNLEKSEFMNSMISKIQDRSRNLAQITHDLKTPLNGIYGLIQAMRGQERSMEDQENFQLIEDCCNHMLTMVDQVLVHEQLKNGGNLLKEEYVDIYRVIENSVAIQRFLAIEKGLEIYSNVSSRVPKIIYTDRGKIAELLSNLLTNALKFTQIGFVSLNLLCRRVEYNRLVLLFMVGDTGVGIEQDRQEKIFEAFHRENYNQTEKLNGTGLGLAIVKQLVKAMNGEIRLVSRPNQGSRFYFTIEAKIDNEEKKDSAIQQEYNRKTPDMDELIEEMEGEVIPEAQKRRKEYFSRAKEFGTVENTAEIIQSLNALQGGVRRENWKAVNQEITKLKLLIPSASGMLRNLLFQLELNVRRCDGNKATAQLLDLEEYFL